MRSMSHSFVDVLLLGALGVVTQCWMFIMIPTMIASAQTSRILFLFIITNNMVAALLLATGTDLMSVVFRGFPAAAVNTVLFGFVGFLNPLRNLYVLNGFNLTVTVQKFFSCFGLMHTWLELACIATIVYTSPRMSVTVRLAIALIILPVAALFEVGYLHQPLA